MASTLKFYLNGILKSLSFAKLLVRDEDYDILDVDGNIYIPKSPSTAVDIGATIPSSFWVLQNDADNWSLMFGTKLIAQFDPVSGNLIYGLGNINNVPINLGGTGADTALEARTNLGLGTAAIFDVGLLEHNLVQLIAGNKLPVLDASNLINLPSLPSGMMAYFARDTPPTGWIRANGSLLLRNTYVNLFNAIATAYGAGDGETTFRVPDLRGAFIRGYDDGRGLDPGRGFGTFQYDALQGHHHAPMPGTNFGAFILGQPNYSTGPHGIGITETGNPITDGSHGTPRTGPETRPVNVALLACIKI
jgi:hypothetical protein